MEAFIFSVPVFNFEVSTAEFVVLVGATSHLDAILCLPSYFTLASDKTWKVGEFESYMTPPKYQSEKFKELILDLSPLQNQ